ncbi:DUF1249 domain-containing protein [Aliidiomarina taiwanensis]|uniref:DUF1249 domain-containing protein n=1 Tax=Aliidiomarina taiwanensis TaxID=946228 RepID=UPI00130055D5|nr:DUF1249 domain-containing protein [Aliidiomarina taiwanensis]
MIKRKYVTNLKELHSLAERNYAGVNRLLLTTEADSWRIQVGDTLDFELTYGLRAPYTTDVVVKQVSHSCDTHSRYHRLDFVVRLYHDVRMAEITSYQGAKRLTAIEPKRPAERGSVPDEKKQLGRLLAEWVALCIQQGRQVLSWQHGNELPQL